MIYLIVAVIMGIVGTIMIGTTFILLANPFSRILTSLNSTMAAFTGGTGTAWNYWVRSRVFIIRMYGVTGVLLLLGSLAVLYLWATRKEVYATQRYR